MIDRVLNSLAPETAAAIEANIEAVYRQRFGEDAEFVPVTGWRRPKKPKRFTESPVRIHMPHAEMPEWLLAQVRANDAERARRCRERKKAS